LSYIYQTLGEFAQQVGHDNCFRRVSTGIVSLASLGTGYTTLAGGALGNVDLIVFDGFGDAGGFVLDNVTLDAAGAAPEPGTLALLGLGLAGLAASRRRKQ
jgi:hypothetical protein